MDPAQVDNLQTAAPSDEAALDEGTQAAPALPEQHDFYKMPAKFGHVPVAEEPLGWDRRRRFEHLYPRVRLPTQVVERFEFGSRCLSQTGSTSVTTSTSCARCRASPSI